ncbi:hypothetical protein GQ473_01920, partial [archaeon]|nr:hypothetical protein [archaeon]
IDVELVDPIIPTNVSQNEFFIFESKITCLDGECGSFDATLDPEQAEDNDGTSGPIFIDTKLWPKNVVNNDTIYLDIRAKDPQGIVSITVDMGGIETITLNLTEGDFYEGRWMGTWIVHDALNIEYNATITAINTLGYSNEINILWEDPIRIGDTMHAELFVDGTFYNLDAKITVPHDSLLGDMTFGDDSTPYGGWGGSTQTNIRNHITAGATAVFIGIVDYDSVICNKTDGRTYGNIDYFEDSVWVSCWKTNDSNYFKVITIPDGTYVNSQWGFNAEVTDIDYAPPVIETNQTYPYQPVGGDNITINVIVSDYNRPGVEWVNFTLINPLGTKVINNENGTNYYNSSLWTTYWNSSYYVIDMIGTWNVSILAGDGDGNSTYSTWTFDVTTKVIPTTVGARPFYTTSDNPQDGTFSNCLSDLRAGDECINNWTVNATGPGDTTWEFFVEYNATTYSAYITDNVTETVNITIKDVTAPQYSLNQTNSTGAESDVLFSLHWTDSALLGYIFSFDNGTGTFVNDSYVGMTGTGNWSNVTKWVNSTVGSTIRWQVYANDTSGNMNDSIIYSFNTISTNININIHEADNSTDKAWSILNIPLDFNYYCYAGMGGCDDSFAADSDGSTANFTIDNIGDSVDVLVYVTSDFNSSTFMLCSSTDDDNDGDDENCKDSPITGQNGADNLQIYINVSGSWGWYNVSNSNRDGAAYALAVDCDVPANINASGIDFQVRAPYGTQGSYGTTIIFVAYNNICSDGDEGTYYTP